MIDVRPAGTHAELAAFVDLPYRLHRSNPCWVPPLRLMERHRFDRASNPFFEHADVQFFVAWANGRARGRVAAIDDQAHNAIHADNLASFGFFEAESEAIAKALLARVEQWAAARGRASVRGPQSFSLNETAGLLIDGFDAPPAVLMPYNPRDYAGYLAAAGYDKVKDLYAWSFDLSRDVDPAIAELAERVRQRYGVRIGSPSRARLLDEIPGFLDIYAKAWAGNWGFVPPTAAESMQFARDLKWIADPDFVLWAEVDGVRAACAVAVPDLNQVLSGTSGRLGPALLLKFLRRRRIVDRARLLLLGVLPEYRKLGLYAVLLAELARRAVGTRFRHAEFSWVLEDNTDINQVAERVGAERTKTYRLYQKAIARRT